MRGLNWSTSVCNKGLKRSMFVCVRVSRLRGIMKLNSRIWHERPAWREKGQGRNIGINRRHEEIRPLSPLLSAVA